MLTISRADRPSALAGAASASPPAHAANADDRAAAGDRIARSSTFREGLHTAGSVSMIAMTPIMLYMAAMPMMRHPAEKRDRPDRASAAQSVET